MWTADATAAEALSEVLALIDHGDVAPPAVVNADAELPSTLRAGQDYSVTYKATVPSSRAPVGTIPHANVHSCLRDVGFCTPFVSNTPGLATHSAALTAQLSPNEATITSEVKLDPGQYTVIIHGRWFDTAGLRHDNERQERRYLERHRCSR